MHARQLIHKYPLMRKNVTPTSWVTPGHVNYAHMITSSVYLILEETQKTKHPQMIKIKALLVFSKNN